VSTPFDQCPVSSVRLANIICDPEHVSPRVGLGGARVSAERVAEFKQMLGEDLQALPEPICVESHGSLILADGYHRLAALGQLAREHPGDRRFEFVSVRVANTPSGQLPAAFAYEIALECSAKGPLPLTRAEKQAAIARLVVEHPECSDREIARRVGVDHKTVGSVRRRGISPADDGSVHDRDGAAASMSPARVARIAARLVRYGDELGTEASDIDPVELVAEIADRFRELRPTEALAWAEWWEDLFGGVRAALEADA
jgi:hypothetical protein